MPVMLVSPQWARKVDKSIKNDSRDCKSSSVTDLYYLIRPAQITSAWSNNQATGVLDDGTEIQIFDPTSQAEIPINSYCNVVYRGRWEILSSAGQGGSGGDKIMRGTVASLIQSSGNPRYNVTGSDGNNYDVELTIFPSVLLIVGKQVVFCVPSDGSQAWLINAESV